MPTKKYLPLRYDDALIRRVYHLTRLKNGYKNGSYVHGFIYNIDEIAAGVSTSERPVEKKDVLALWWAFGRNRQGFVDDVEWRLCNLDTVADSIPKMQILPMQRRAAPEKKLVANENTLVAIEENLLITFADACMKTGSLSNGLMLLKDSGIDVTLAQLKDFLQTAYGGADAFFDTIAPRVREYRKNKRST